MRDQSRSAPIEKAFRHYRDRYALFRKFDRPLPFGWESTCRAIVQVFRVLGLDGAVATLLRPILRRMCMTHQPDTPLALVFSTNQSAVARKLLDLEIPLSPVSLGSFSLAFEDDGPKIGDFLLLVASLANASQTRRALRVATQDPVMANNSARVVKACGIAFVLEVLFRGVEKVVLFNDHTPYAVLSHDMAKERGLDTVYFQHAPVSEDFPALYNDLNVLFSQAAVDMYDVRPGAEVFLFFDLRMLDCLSCDVSPDADRPVLVCTNEIDEFECIQNLVIRLLEENFSVIVRPHPRENRRWNQLPSSVEVSRSGSIWQDLERSGPVLANESAVGLDAIFMGKLFYKCGFLSPRSYDSYRFLRERLITTEYQSVDQLLVDIEGQKRAYDPGKLDYFVGPCSEWRKRRNRLREVIA